MYHWYRNLAIAALIWGLSVPARAQEESYVLKRQIFKVALSSINFSPDGSLLLAGFTDGSFKILNPESFLPTLEVSNAHYKAVNAMDMPPKMDFILSAGHNTLKLWDRSGKYMFDLKAHATTIWNAEISQDGLWAVSSAMNKTFQLWDLPNHILLQGMRGHKDVCLAVSISPDMRMIASGSKDLSILIWDLETRKVISTMHGPTEDIYDVEFSPDSRLLVATSKDKSVRVYDVAGAKLLHLLKGHGEMVMEAEFSPDGKYLVTGSADHTVILWDVLSGEKIYQFFDLEATVMDLAYHPDGLSFYSITTAGDLTRWVVHPEIFVLKNYEEAYLKEFSDDPVFEPKQKGESKKAYEARQRQAEAKKEAIIERYYQQYLRERDR
jgi:WD40 repeat protein